MRQHWEVVFVALFFVSRFVVQATLELANVLVGSDSGRLSELPDLSAVVSFESVLNHVALLPRDGARLVNLVSLSRAVRGVRLDATVRLAPDVSVCQEAFGLIIRGAWSERRMSVSR